MSVRMAAGLGTALWIFTAAAHGDEVTCANYQSPRRIDDGGQPTPYGSTSHLSMVKVLTPDRVVYTPRAGGEATPLERCGQHYHLPIENPQGCPGEMTPGSAPEPGSWVEVHTVYAAKVRQTNCDPEALDCCEAGPFLVRGFAARVTAKGQADPIVPPPGLPLAEWTGSTTGPESTPGECKPPAQWSFRLGCEFTLSRAQLGRFKHAHPARPVQSGPRLSPDLTRVTP